jgi:hypothetical protein
LKFLIVLSLCGYQRPSRGVHIENFSLRFELDEGNLMVEGGYIFTPWGDGQWLGCLWCRMGCAGGSVAMKTLNDIFVDINLQLPNSTYP